jgi:hypothetical protein
LSIKFTHRGSFDHTEKFFRAIYHKNYRPIVEKYAAQGLTALKNATPIETGETKDRWNYEIVVNRGGLKIYWTNDHENQGIPIVILLQYGHGTRGGTYVTGRDFINPAMKPTFDAIAENIWKEVTSL